MSLSGKSLIVTIVKKGRGDQVLDASMKAGAEGGTIIFGREDGVHEQQKIMGICIEPEKEIVFSVIANELIDPVLDSITRAVNLDKPGNGIAFVIPIEKAAGIAHALKA